MGELQVSQTDLARAIGMSQGQLSEFLAGAGVSVERLEKIMQKLDIRIVTTEAKR